MNGSATRSLKHAAKGILPGAVGGTLAMVFIDVMAFLLVFAVTD